MKRCNEGSRLVKLMKLMKHISPLVGWSRVGLSGVGLRGVGLSGVGLSVVGDI